MNKIILTSILLTLITLPAFCGIQVKYLSYYNDQLSAETAPIIMECSDSTAKIYSDYQLLKLSDILLKEATYIDYRKHQVLKTMINKNGEIFHIPTEFSSIPKMTIKNEIEVIEVGKKKYNCKKGEVILFSNKIEVWFTEDLKETGTPSPRSGIVPGVVLKFSRNGNYVILASEINKTKQHQYIIPDETGIAVDDATYYQLSVENYSKTIAVFKNEQICWGWDKNHPAYDSTTQVHHFVNGTILLKKVTLPETTKSTTIFAELTQYSNGDAYDRTGSVFIIPTDKKQSFLDGLKNGINALPSFKSGNNFYQGVVATDTYSPLLEIMRFFTPFGVRHFNDKRKVKGIDWEDAAFYKQDITELRTSLEGEVWIGTFIGNYDQGGHIVSLDLKYYPGTLEAEKVETPEQKPWILPIFNTLNVMEMAGQNYGTMFAKDSLTIDFEIPNGIHNIKLRYITTGHGGWGNGDEFVPKVNQIIIDGVKQFEYTPWRSDCGTYRKYNPSSGNFWNGISSSDGSRSGWCPGTTTNPVYFNINNLTPGKHNIKIAIQQGENEGNSFSSWNVSGVLTGDRKN